MGFQRPITGPQGQQCYTLMGFSILYKNSLLLLLLLLLLLIGDDFLKMLRMLQGILADDQAVFRCYLLFVSKCTTEDDEHLTIISEWRVAKMS